VPRPEPGAGEVLVRVEAAGANAGDWHLCRGTPMPVRLMFGLARPKHPILGSDVAGVVEAAGTDAGFAPGDEVVAILESHGFGGFAEHVCVPASSVVAKPAGLGFDDAAELGQAAITALQATRDVLELAAGERVVIFGASGGVGSFAVSLARHLGARVTAVCSAGKLDHVRALGPEAACAYEALPPDAAGGFDAVLIVHARMPVRRHLAYARRGGRVMLVGAAGYAFLHAAALMPAARLGGRRLLPPWVARPRVEDQREAGRLAAEGVLRPRVDRTFPLDGVGRALAELEAGRATGKLIVTPHA